MGRGRGSSSLAVVNDMVVVYDVFCSPARRTES